MRMSEVVKAPAKVGRKELVELEREEKERGRAGAGNVGVPELEVPRAPGSVFDLPAIGEATPTSTPGSTSTSNSNHTPIQTPAQTSTSISTSTPSQTGMLEAPKQARRPAVSPLRSALRNSSRTPSPMLGHAPAPAAVADRASSPARTSGSGVSGSSGPGRAPSPAPVSIPGRAPSPASSSTHASTSMRAGTTVPRAPSRSPPGPTPESSDIGVMGRAPGSVSVSPTSKPQEKSASVNTVPTQRHEDGGKSKDKGKGIEEAVVDEESSDDDDGASVSSYETGYEVFFGGDDEEETIPGPTTFPAQVLAQAPPPPSHEHDYAKTAPAQPTQAPLQNGSAHHPPRSDVSTSTISGEARGTTSELEPTRRRKSVRVSLQPTFSPTPPAIEDDDENYEQHVPWGRAAGSGVGKGKGKAQTGKGAGTVAPGDSGTMVDMWQDSSEEDVEYSRAKRLLSRVGRKEKKKKAAA
ncbi:hypothetical protein BDZ94DRAFT_1248223 [Collybia nuda]|uniref:Uncharacterized protein n=1 Tax=Collybia nuda TaxID=64659 RepID=A0A9P6CIK8_9AGAR|nr:hypothetical protein BDZ94DRAFT_1248223 [Collybia nuda]